MAANDQWWLTVNHHIAGKTYKSLTQQLLFARYIVCDAMLELQVEGKLAGPVEVHIVKNGVPQSGDVFNDN